MIKSRSTIHAIIRNTLILLMLLSLSFGIWLYMGISIEKLRLYNVNIDGLYLKLDKKLILKANKVTVAKSKKALDPASINKIVDRIRYGFNFFELIQLKSVHFKNNHYYFTYVNNVLHIVSDEYESVVDIKREGSLLKADISLLYIKKEDITLWGKLEYHLPSGRVGLKGSYRAYDLQGKLELDKVKSKISLRLDANETTSIDRVINRFIKNPKTNEWILRRIHASNYKLDELRADGVITNGEFKLDVDSIYGLLYADNVDVYFNRHLKKAVHVKKLKLIYQKGSLDFNLSHPTYQDKNITHGHAVIDGLTNHKPYLHLDLALTSRFDHTISEILTAYKLKVPIIQKSGKTNASLTIGVDLKKRGVKVEGDFNLSKGVVNIAKAPLSITNAQIHYANKEVIIKKSALENRLYKGEVTGKVDITTKKVDLDIDLDYFKVAKKRKTIIDARKLKLPLTLTYHDGVKFDIPKLKTKIHTHKSTIVFDFADMNILKPYVQVLPSDLNGGSLTLSTKNFKTFKLNGYAAWKECFLYTERGLCHTRLPFSGTIKKGHLKLNIFKNKIKLFTYSDTIYVNGIHIDLAKLLRSKNRKTSTKHHPKKVMIWGKNSTISYKKYRLLTNHYTMTLYKHKFVFDSQEGKRSIHFSKQGDQITIDAKNIDDKMLHPLINFKSLKGGKYHFSLKGDMDGKMNGKVIIKGGMVKKFQGYNNLVAFVNAIPALMTLSNPGFDNEGFRIKEGEIVYTIEKQNIIKFQSIEIVGGSSTIVGAGEINIAKKSVKMDLGIQMAREIGKVVGAIPIVGYILVGDGKSIAMGVTVRGSLNNPKIESQPIKDMISLPLGMIDRLFKSPKRLLEGNKKGNSNR